MEDKNIALYAQKLVVLQNGKKFKEKLFTCYLMNFTIILSHNFKKNKMCQTRNFLFSFFLFYL